MALRVKVELVPHGVEARAEVLDEFIIGNNGTGVSGGRDSGGVGNYDIYDLPLAELHMKDEPSMYKLGEVRGIPRSEGHRLEVVRRALQIVERLRKEERPA